MSSQTSLVAEQVRLRQWAAQIQECQSRPADMKACNPEPAFVELPVPEAETISSADFHDVKPAAILRNSRGLTLEIYNHASTDIIRGTMEVLLHAE